MGAVVISLLIGACVPYVALRQGLTPNNALIGAIMGSILMSLLARKTSGRNRLQINFIQAAASSAGATAFMCTILAAFDLLDLDRTVNIHVQPRGTVVFLWLTLGGLIGTLVAVIRHRRFMNDPSLKFVDGIVAAEAIVMRDSDTPETRQKRSAVKIAALMSGVLVFARDGIKGLLPELPPLYGPLKIALPWSPMGFGTGLLLPVRMGVWILVGVVCVRIGGPQVVDYVTSVTHATTSPWAKYFGWIMWPATTLMVMSEFTNILLILGERFFPKKTSADEAVARLEFTPVNVDILSLRAALTLIAVLTSLLALVLFIGFGVPAYLSCLGVLASFPLVEFGVSILGQTNLGPVSVMTNALQIVFRFFFSSNVLFNLFAAGSAGVMNAQAEDGAQVFRTAQILKANPRMTLYGQWIGCLTGSLAVTLVYPILTAKFRIGVELTAPTATKFATMAVFLNRGFDALPPGALQACAVAAVAAVVLAIIGRRWSRWFVPQGSSFALALLLPAVVTIPIALGALVGALWKRARPAHHERWSGTVACGLIIGEALIAGLLLPLLFFLGILRQPQ